MAMEKPLTREDVLRRIKENGGTTNGLDLSEKWFEGKIDLRKLDLTGIILEGADLREAHLEGAYLREAHLEGAFLSGAHLEGADLEEAHLEGAVLEEAHLEGAGLRDAHLEGAGLVEAHLEGAVLVEAHLEGAALWGAHLSSETDLAQVDWGSFILKDEKDGWFDEAVATYRKLKQWYTDAGIYDIAGEFFFREMTARRKTLEWWPKPWNRAFSKILSMLCGYGEKPEKVVISALAIIFGLAAAYYFRGSFSSSSFWDSLYYSAVSFTALGYGDWAPEPAGWAKGMGAAEAVIGVFMMALFLVTFTRKMTR